MFHVWKKTGFNYIWVLLLLFYSYFTWINMKHKKYMLLSMKSFPSMYECSCKCISKNLNFFFRKFYSFRRIFIFVFFLVGSCWSIFICLLVKWTMCRWTIIKSTTLILLSCIEHILGRLCSIYVKNALDTSYSDKNSIFQQKKISIKIFH